MQRGNGDVLRPDLPRQSRTSTRPRAVALADFTLETPARSSPEFTWHLVVVVFTGHAVQPSAWKLNRYPSRHHEKPARSLRYAIIVNATWYPLRFSASYSLRRDSGHFRRGGGKEGSGWPLCMTFELDECSAKWSLDCVFWFLYVQKCLCPEVS